MLCDICIFGAEQHISKRHSALAVLTRPDKAPKEKKTRATKNIGASACRYLQPTSVRMVTTLPTESQRYRESGVLRGIIFEGKNEGLTSSHISRGSMVNALILIGHRVEIFEGGNSVT